jgi:hypothetical protein
MCVEYASSRPGHRAVTPVTLQRSQQAIDATPYLWGWQAPASILDRLDLLQSLSRNRRLIVLLMETHTAKDWPPFAWPEGNDRCGATCRARHGSLDTHTHVSVLSPTRLAVLRVMAELLFAKENLLAALKTKGCPQPTQVRDLSLYSMRITSLQMHNQAAAPTLSRCPSPGV